MEDAMDWIASWHRNTRSCSHSNESERQQHINSPSSHTHGCKCVSRICTRDAFTEVRLRDMSHECVDPNCAVAFVSNKLWGRSEMKLREACFNVPYLHGCRHFQCL
uniref:Uncharacterized protein n=1 Tax=Arundo donax TaxID=35708 RepID=A0A0A9FP87_ARUDO